MNYNLEFQNSILLTIRKKIIKKELEEFSLINNKI